MTKIPQNFIIFVKIPIVTLFQENEFFLVKILDIKFLKNLLPHQFL